VIQQVTRQAAGQGQDVFQGHLHLVTTCFYARTGLRGWSEIEHE
jgi:hypothetical protein